MAIELWEMIFWISSEIVLWTLYQFEFVILHSTVKRQTLPSVWLLLTTLSIIVLLQILWLFSMLYDLLLSEFRFDCNIHEVYPWWSSYYLNFTITQYLFCTNSFWWWWRRPPHDTFLCNDFLQLVSTKCSKIIITFDNRHPHD